MSFIRYKKRGTNWYAYEVSNHWDKKLKKYRQTNIYLVVAKEKGGEFYKNTSIGKEKLIVDFGDGYAIMKIIEKTGLLNIIQNIFLEKSDKIIALICHQLINGSAINYAEDWLSGSIINNLLPNINISLQDISKLLKTLGTENCQRKFFELYIKNFFKDNHSILIDSTSLPFAIESSVNDWEYSYNGIEKNIGCLILADKSSKLPIFFRIIPDAIPDISTLKLMFTEIHTLGLNIDEVIFDADYFSENNIAYLCEQNVDFISRLPKSRKLFKSLIEELTGIEKSLNAVKYNERIVFIESKKICFYNNEMFAHIVLEPEKKLET